MKQHTNIMSPTAVSVVTITNFQAGIELWLTDKQGWPKDFHNQFYQELDGLRASGLGSAWWTTIVDHLASWRAIRPLTKGEIHQRGQEQLANLQKEYDKIWQVISKSRSVGLHNIFWHEVSSLYNIAFVIKGVNSPVFASKLCHFIFPELFPVIDQEVIGINTTTYEAYWRYCKREWEQCATKENLIDRLSITIGGPLTLNYPFSTKIVELCLIGHRKNILSKEHN